MMTTLDELLAMNPIMTASRGTPGKGLALDSRAQLPVGVPACSLRLLTADPVGARNGEFWFRTDTLAFCVMTGGAVKRATLS